MVQVCIKPRNASRQSRPASLWVPPLLDTPNVLSAMMSAEPASQVAAWGYPGNAPSSCCHRRPSGRRKSSPALPSCPKAAAASISKLRRHAMFAEDFEGRVLPFDMGRGRFPMRSLRSPSRRAGTPGRHHRSHDRRCRARAGREAWSTRNVGDFEECGVEIVNPWAARPWRKSASEKEHEFAEPLERGGDGTDAHVRRPGDRRVARVELRY